MFLPTGPKHTNLIEDVEFLLPTRFGKFGSAVSENKSKMSQPIRGRAAIFDFQSA